MADLMRGARNKIVDDIMSEKVDIDLSEDKGAQSWEGAGGYSYEILAPGQIKVTGSSDSKTLKGGKSVVVTDPSMVRAIMSERDMTDVMETERTPEAQEMNLASKMAGAVAPERASVKMTDPGDKSPGEAPLYPTAASLREMMQGGLGDPSPTGGDFASLYSDAERQEMMQGGKGISSPEGVMTGAGPAQEVPEQGLLGEASSYLSGLMAKAQEAGDVASFQKISKLVAQMMKGQ